MATMTVWKFDSPDGADQAIGRLESLQKEGLVAVLDAATVSWPEGAKKPKTHQQTSLTGVGAAGGAFWGLLFGMLFFVPFLGAAFGAAMGAIGGALSDVGIDDDFIASVRGELTPGTSALFLMSSDAVIDKLGEAFGGMDMLLVRSNLSDEEEGRLRDVFAEV